MFKKIFFSVLSTVCLLIVTITVAYAWYITKVADDFKSPLITGKSTAAYYAGGDGSKAKPYKIANERHLYNLAWLQYLGTYNKDYDEDGVVDQYYFEVINDIDCNDLVLPPIGTIDNPFLGNFDGNGYVIKNLSITNDYDNLVKKPSSINAESKFSGVEIIGFFGVIGKYAGFVDANISSEVNSAYDFNLDDLIIQNSSTNTLAGLVAGFVNANVSNVGVHYGKIELESGTKNISTFKNISGYTLIGDYDSELVSWEDKPSYGNGSGSDLAYGGSFDTDTFFKRLNLIYENKTSDTPSDYLPNMESETVLSEGYKVPLTVVGSTITSQNYSGPNAKETVSSENIGYATGNQNKSREINMQWSDPLIAPNDMQNGNYANSSGETPEETKTIPRQMFKVIGQNGNYQASQIRPLTDDEFAALPQNIQDLIPSENKKEKRTFLRLQQRWPGTVSFTNSTQNDSWSYLGQISYYGQNYGEDVGPYQEGGIALPNNAIWFKPKKAGTVRIVMYSADNGKSFRINKIRRDEANLQNPFAGTSFTVLDDPAVNEVNNLAKNIPAYMVVYYEFEITQEDIDAGNIEYTITKGDENGAYFYYLDIGISGNENAPSVNPELKNSAIEGVDFVYLNHNTDKFSSTADDYSSVFFQISGTTNGLTEFYFRRNNDNEDNYAGSEGIVLYFAKNENESSWTTTSSGRTDGSSSLDWSYAGTKGEAGDSGGYTAEDCEVLADSKSSGGLANTNTGASTTFTITYNYINENDEVVYITKGKVTKGYAITTPTFEVDGYNLINWYTDESLNTEYDFSKAVDSNIILYASSEVVQTHIVTFKDGDTILATDVVNNGSYATITTPTKLGYVFSHWEDADGNEVDIETTQITEDLTLKAAWADAYNITFAYNIGEDDVVIKTIQVKQGSKVVRPEEPELPGYKFVNWYTDKNYNSTFNYDNAPTGNITIYAKFDEIPHYTVTYIYVENSVTTTIMVDSVEENATPIKPDDPTREGYVFMGWFKDEAFENEFDFSEEITANTVVYAYWQKGITITFQYEDGSVIETMSIMSNNTVTPTAIVPTKAGYRFNGNWYLFVDGVASNEAFDFETKLLDDTILVPGWIKTYDVTFVNNNNTSNTVMTVDTGQEVTQPDDPTYEGYKFVGWYSDIDCTIAQTFPITVTSDMTIYADWVQLITITLVVDGKESYVYTEENETITLPNSMDGYYLISWSDGVTTYQPGEEITVTSAKTYEANAVKKYTVTIKNGTTTIDELTSDIDGHVTLPQALENGNAVFAGWSDGNTIYEASEVITVTSNMTINATWTYASSVVFNANGGTIGENETVVVTLTDGLVTSLPEDPTREDYIFTGWYLDAEGTVKLDTSNPITVDTIYAGWEEESTRTVTFYANEGTFADGSTSIQVKVKSNGKIVSMPEEPTRNDQVFNGWYVKQNSWDGNDTLLTIDTEIPEGYNVYARWSPLYPLKVRGIYNGNQIFETTINVPTEMVVETLEAPVYSGYEAVGWYSDSNCTSLLFPHTFGQHWNADVYVKYELKKYTVTFETNDGSSIDSQEIIEGETIIIPDNPTKLGYEFLGWYTDQALNNEFVESSPITSDTTLYAKWNFVGTATVTYVLNGGTGIESEEVTIGSVIINEPTKAGFNFAGWYIDESLTNEFVSVVESNMTLYAKWEAGATITFILNTDGGFAPAVNTIQSITNTDGFVAFPKAYDGYYFANDNDDYYNDNRFISGWRISGTETIITGSLQMFDGEYRVVSSVALDEDVTLEAVWATNIMTAYFDLNGSGTSLGSELFYVAQREANSNSLGYAYPPIDPTKNGQTFKHWIDAWGNVRLELDSYSQESGQAYFHAVFE